MAARRRRRRGGRRQLVIRAGIRQLAVSGDDVISGPRRHRADVVAALMSKIGYIERQSAVLQNLKR